MEWGTKLPLSHYHTPRSHLLLSHIFRHFLCQLQYTSTRQRMVADRRETKEMLACFANERPIQDSKWLKNSAGIWGMCCRTSVHAEHSGYFNFVFSERCHPWLEFQCCVLFLQLTPYLNLAPNTIDTYKWHRACFISCLVIAGVTPLTLTLMG